MIFSLEFTKFLSSARSFGGGTDADRPLELSLQRLEEHEEWANVRTPTMAFWCRALQTPDTDSSMFAMCNFTFALYDHRTHSLKSSHCLNARVSCCAVAQENLPVCA